MKQQLSQIILYFVLGVIIVISGLALINFYLFSITGFLLGSVGICSHKSVRVPVENGYPQKLSFTIDVEQAALEMKKNSNYEVNLVHSERAVISRMFGVVKYNITLEKRNDYGRFNLDTFNFKGYPNSSSVDGGEKCSTPNRILRENVYQMINDLPLTELQKNEMKQYVTARMVLDIKMF